ncbi:unnamed protein product, partial [Anisakis simplex]|uniref:Hemagglutinin n=1 Tax=Anisakis simplex TaxID=6269 RepID=A0A0M3K8U8_ANISI
MEGTTAGESADITKRITRTVVTRSNYGTSSVSGAEEAGTLGYGGSLTGGVLTSGALTTGGAGAAALSLATGAAGGGLNMTSVYDTA